MSLFWIAMPIVIAVVYLVIGSIIANKMVATDYIESSLGWWTYVLFWLPIVIWSGFYHAISWLISIPINLAERQIKKHLPKGPRPFK